MIKLTKQIAITTLQQKIDDQNAKQSHAAFWFAIVTMFDESLETETNLTLKMMGRWPTESIARMKTVARGIQDELEAIELIT